MEATEAWVEEIVEGEDSDSKFKSFVEEAKELHLLVEEWVGLFTQLSNNDAEKSAVDSKRTAKRISDIVRLRSFFLHFANYDLSWRNIKSSHNY